LRTPTAPSFVSLMRVLSTCGGWAAVVTAAIVAGQAAVVDAGGYGPGACGRGHCGAGHCNPGHCGAGGCGPCGPGLCGDGLCGHHDCRPDVAEKRYFLRSQGKSWHSAWYDPAEGRPIALVVPPTAEFQTQYGWGVPSSRVMPIYHQFRRPYPGPGGVGGAGGGFMPTPNQPSDTVQFGVNAVRGPWGAY